VDQQTANILLGVVGGIVTFFASAAGLELIKRVLPSKDKQLDLQSEVQKQHREDMVWLRSEVGRLTTELDRWRTKYFDMLQERADEIDAWEKKYDTLQKESEKRFNDLLLRYNALETEVAALRARATLKDATEGASP
jgi:hypothetical protein